jgi:hypothetical protein
MNDFLYYLDNGLPPFLKVVLVAALGMLALLLALGFFSMLAMGHYTTVLIITVAVILVVLMAAYYLFNEKKRN